MGQELAGVSGIRAMLAARSVVERVATNDVSWLLAGRKLASVAESMRGAAADALEGAAHIGDDLPDAADRLRHAAAMLDQAQPLTAARDTWNAGRADLLQARDAIDDAIVQTRESLRDVRSADAEAAAAAVDRIAADATGSADDLRLLADLSELPSGLRPMQLEHVTTGDLKLLREQAQRMEEGLRPSREARLAELLATARIAGEDVTREATEARLTSAANRIAERSMERGASSSIADELRAVSGLQGLDPTLRPRALTRTLDVPWTEAAELASRDRLPWSWDGIERLRSIAQMDAPTDTLASLVHTPPEAWTGKQWRTLASLVRLAPDERPAELMAFGSKHARQMDSVAAMVDRGRPVPGGWKPLDAVGDLRGKLLWSSRSRATDHLDAIVRTPANELTREHFADLDAMRRLPDDIRPVGLANGQDLWGDIARTGLDASSVDGKRALDAFGKLSVKLRSPDELHAALDRVDEHVAALTSLQQQFGGNAQVPRGILGDFGSDLHLIRAFEHDEQAMRMLDDTAKLVQRNIDRLDGKVGGGYGRHVDYADLGRIRENVRLFSTLSRHQIADDAAKVADDVATVAEDAAKVADGAADDMPTWELVEDPPGVDPGDALTW